MCYELLRLQLKAAKLFLNIKFFISQMFITNGSVATIKIQRSPPQEEKVSQNGTVAFVSFAECLEVCTCLINT